MIHSRKLVGSIKSYMTIFISTIFISAAIVVLLLFILYIMSPNVPNVYASSSSTESRLTIIESGDVPDRTRWEYRIYSVELGDKYPRYYIEYYNTFNDTMVIEQIIDNK